MGLFKGFFENRKVEKFNKELDDMFSAIDDDYDDFDEDDDSEALSVDDAADIWRSHGMDEDYTFGYSEDELRDSL